VKFDCTFCDKIIDEKDIEQIDYCRNLHHELLTMPNDTVPKQSKKLKKPITKIKGYIGNLYVESVVIDGKPSFLVRHLDETEDIVVKDKIKHGDEIYKPLELDQYGYLQYNFTSSEIIRLLNSEISKESVLDEIKNQIDHYIVAKDLDKHLILGDILLTYCLEWVSTVHYPYFVGETESGKSTVLHLGKWLNYRCMYGEDVPMADIYRFLGSDEEGCGTIEEDEAQEIGNNREKIRAYKNSYSKGSTKARMMMLQNSQQQKFYKTFSSKWFAGERIYQDKGFLERLAIVYMTEGEPQSNIKRVTKEESDTLSQIRNSILVWKLQNIGKDPEKIDSGLKGRDQELWEDYIRVVSGTKYFERCQNVVAYYVKQRQEVIRNSLEAKLFSLLIQRLDSNLQLNFIQFWEFITNDNPDLYGSFKNNSQRTFYPDDYPDKITHHSLAKIIDYKFQGERLQRKFRENNIQRQQTLYSFKNDVLEKLVRKYGIELPVDHILYVGQHGQLDQQSGNQIDQDDQGKESRTPSPSFGNGG